MSGYVSVYLFQISSKPAGEVQSTNAKGKVRRALCGPSRLSENLAGFIRRKNDKRTSVKCSFYNYLRIVQSYLKQKNNNRPSVKGHTIFCARVRLALGRSGSNN